MEDPDIVVFPLLARDALPTTAMAIAIPLSSTISPSARKKNEGEEEERETERKGRITGKSCPTESAIP